MTRRVAFLRAINVGGHNVKMDALRKLFESLGYTDVQTFIASGNVIFETDAKNAHILETQIEKKLKASLGYNVSTFIRTGPELSAILKHKPFSVRQLDSARALNVAFIAEPLGDAANDKLMARKTDIDDFHVNGREIYWLCGRKQSESTFSNVVLEKTIGKPSTLRGLNTVRQLADKYFV